MLSSLSVDSGVFRANIDKLSQCDRLKWSLKSYMQPYIARCFIYGTSNVVLFYFTLTALLPIMQSVLFSLRWLTCSRSIPSTMDGFMMKRDCTKAVFRPCSGAALDSCFCQLLSSWWEVLLPTLSERMSQAKPFEFNWQLSVPQALQDGCLFDKWEEVRTSSVFVHFVTF